MIRIATAYSQSTSAKIAAETVSRDALDKAGLTRADIVIVFVSSTFRKQLPLILKIIRKMTQAQQVIGASGYGILTEDIEVERQRSLAIMAMAGSDIPLQGFFESNLQESNFHAGQRIAESIYQEAVPVNGVICFPDIYSFQSGRFFDGFEQTSDYVPILGGTAAEDGKEEKSYQIYNDHIAYDAVAGFALKGNLRFEAGITKSCRPFGDSFQVTRAEGNIIYEMDGRPAYDILLESISHIPFKNPSQIFQNVFLGVPLRHFQTEFKGSNFLIRNITGTNAKKGMLACITPVDEGEFVTFTIRNAELAREDMKLMLEDLRLRTDPRELRFGLYFNSCARGTGLYGKPDEDIRMIRSYFPHLPVLGFFSYGELMPIDHVNLLHHHSGVLVLVREQS